MKKAVAVTYKSNLPAPFIVAKGKYALAEKIIELAESHGIYIMEEETLTDRRFMEEPGNFIPEEIYEVVAEILAYVYTTRSKMESL